MNLIERSLSLEREVPGMEEMKSLQKADNESVKK